MKLSRIKTHGVLALAIITLQACGGGGGGGGSSAPPREDTAGQGKSLEQLIEIYSNLVEETYTGSNSPADLNATTIVPFARAVLSEEAPQEQYVTAKTRKLTKSIPSSLKSILRQRSYQTPPSALSLASPKATRERVDETDSCDNQEGSARVTGTLSDLGAGALDIDYNNCLLGGILMDGPAVLFLGEYQNTQDYFYNNTKMVIDNESVRITGRISNDQVDGGMISSLVFINEKSGFQYRMRDYHETTIGSSSYADYYTVAGNLYLPTQGWVNVEGSYSLSLSQTNAVGSLTLLSGNKKAVIALNDTEAEIELTNVNSASDTLVAKRPVYDLLHYNGAVALNLVSRAKFGNPPQYNSFAIADSQITTLDPIETVLAGLTDDEGNEITATYEWRINNVRLDNQTASILPAGIAKGGDLVGVKATLSDGYNTAETDEATLNIQDSLPTVVASELPQEISVGSSLQVNLQYGDPDFPDQFTSRLELAYGPEGAAIDAEGVLRWSPSSLLFGTAQTFYFGIRAQGSDSTPIEIQIKAVDNTARHPLVRTSIHNSYSYDRNGIAAAQLGADATPELLVVGNQGDLFSLQKQDEIYVQTWVYAFAPDDGSVFRQIKTADIDGNNRSEAYLITDLSLYSVTSKHTLANSLYNAPSNMHIIDFDIADLDNDNHPEAVLLLKSSTYDQDSLIVIVDLVSGRAKQQLTVQENAEAMAIGNVDADAAKEIVLSSGFVYDGSTLENQWFYGNGFSQSMAVGDTNNDGVDEIAFARNSSTIALLSAVSKSEIASIESGNSCTLWFENLDNDPKDELVSSCSGETLKAFDLGDVDSPQQQWSSEIQSSNAKSLLVADVDGDGEREIIWAGYDNSRYTSSLVIADIDNQGREWVSSLNSMFTSFYANGWARLTPQTHHASFIVTHQENGAARQQFAFLSKDGEFEFRDYLPQRSTYIRSSQVVDVDHDGIDELFVAYNVYPGLFEAINLEDTSSIWRGNTPNADYYINMVGAADLNGDGFEDALYATEKNVMAVDLQTETLITTINTGKSFYGGNFATADTEGDGTIEVFATDDEGLSLWRKTGASYTKQTTVEGQRCSRIIADRFEKNVTPKVLCLTSGPFGGFNRAIKVFRADLSLEKTIDIDQEITDIASLAVSPDENRLLISTKTQTTGNYSSNIIGNISLYSLAAGRPVWSSPILLGSVKPGTLHGLRDDNGHIKLMFSTDYALYVTH